MRLTPFLFSVMMVGVFGACPSLVTGPYAPGGLRPNEGLSPLN